jgi:DNA-binding response OmpR family regulator
MAKGKTPQKEEQTGNEASKTILLIEDDTVLRNMYEQRLKMDGYSILCAGDGEEGFRMFQENEIGLLVTDIMLPRMSGTELVEKVRKTKKGADLKIIAWSNLANEGEKNKLLDFGVSEYLVKSAISLDQLSETVKKYLI